MPGLELLRKDLQQLLSVMSSVIGADFFLANKERLAIAGSGRYQKNIGTIRPRESYMSLVLATRETATVHEPRFSRGCLRCELRNICPYSSAMMAPIASSEVLGTLGIVTYTKEQREDFSVRHQEWASYLASMANLIGVQVSLIETQLEKRILEAAMRELVDQTSDGVLIADHAGRVNYINKRAEELLKVRDKECIGQMLLELIQRYSSVDIQQESNQTYWVELNKARKGLYGSIRPVGSFEGLEGPIITVIKEEDGKKLFPIFHQEVEKASALARIVGESSNIQRVKKQIAKVAASTATVLILGESGTGKELVAEAIHELSKRKGPLIKLNCATLPESLVEAELFGYDPGAFTGARKEGKPGKFELAEGGTIFLDEVEAFPLALQPKLLRVLEEKSVDRLGSGKKGGRPVDVRVIAASNHDLEAMVRRGEFREDLFYRLNVVAIRLAPLRERKDDLMLLANQFFPVFNDVLGKAVQGFAPELVDHLVEYSWPGNVRELRNVIEYAVIMTEDDWVTLADLPDYLQERLPIKAQAKLQGEKKLQELECVAVAQALEKFGISTEGKKLAAEYLGISLATLYRYIKKYQIELADSK